MAGVVEIAGRNTTTNNPELIQVVSGASLVTGPDGGQINGGIKMADVYNPARDIYIDWIFGSEDTNAALTASVEATGFWVEMGLLNPSARTIVIVNGDTVSCDYSYSVEFSRNHVGTTDDTYTVASVGAGAKSKITQVDLSAEGYDVYCRLKITPTAGQTINQLLFKAYLVGRGG